MEILVGLVRVVGGAVFWVGLKKDWAMSRPPGPKDEDDELLCIVLVFVYGKVLSLSLVSDYMLQYVVGREGGWSLRFIGTMEMKASFLNLYRFVPDKNTTRPITMAHAQMPYPNGLPKLS